MTLRVPSDRFSKNLLICSRIKMSVADAYKSLLLRCATLMEAIQKLSQVYSITSEVAKQTLWKKFLEHSMVPQQSIAN